MAKVLRVTIRHHKNHHLGHEGRKVPLIFKVQVKHHANMNVNREERGPSPLFQENIFLLLITCWYRRTSQKWYHCPLPSKFYSLSLNEKFKNSVLMCCSWKQVVDVSANGNDDKNPMHAAVCYLAKITGYFKKSYSL